MACILSPRKSNSPRGIESNISRKGTMMGSKVQGNLIPQGELKVESGHAPLCKLFPVQGNLIPQGELKERICIVYKGKGCSVQGNLIPQGELKETTTVMPKEASVCPRKSNSPRGIESMRSRAALLWSLVQGNLIPQGELKVNMPTK